MPDNERFSDFSNWCKNEMLVENGLTNYQWELSLHLYLKHWNDLPCTRFFSESYFLVKWKRKLQEPFEMLNC